jgi:hypothetical protein
MSDIEDDEDDERKDEIEDDADDYFEIEKHISQHGLRSFYDSYLIKDKINLQPEYQRDFVWNADKQNLLIDSIMRSFVIPNFILIKDHSKKYTYECIDGQHRLNVVKYFITGEKLKGNYVRLQKKNTKCILENIFYEKNINTENNRAKFKRYMTEEEKDKFDAFPMTLCIINSKHSFKDVCTIFNRLQNGERCSKSIGLKNQDHPLAELLRKSGVCNRDNFKKTKIGEYLWDIFFENKKNILTSSINNFFVSIMMRYAIIYIKGIDSITSYLDMNLHRDIEIKSERVDISRKSSDEILKNLECFLERVTTQLKNKNLTKHMFYILADIYNHNLNGNMSRSTLKNIISSDVFNTYNNENGICEKGKIPPPERIRELRNLIIDIVNKDLIQAPVVNHHPPILKIQKSIPVRVIAKGNSKPITVKAVTKSVTIKNIAKNNTTPMDFRPKTKTLDTSGHNTDESYDDLEYDLL